jgi:hypothetical protein
MTVLALDLGASVLAAERATRWIPLAGMLAAVEDPFRLDLPVVGGDPAADIDAGTMEILGGLYLIAQLEQTGMLRVAELLIESRFELALTSTEAAELLDELAVESADWYPADQRDQLYARVFGLGPAVGSRSGPANGDLPQLIVGLCSAITAWDDATRFGGTGATRRRTGVAQAVRLLRANLALRQYGNTLAAARRIAGQVRDSYALLIHPGVVALVGGIGMWDVVRALWDGAEPDIDRLVSLGQSGQQLIGWAGSAPAEAGEPTASVVEAASLWLLGAGFELAGAA